MAISATRKALRAGKCQTMRQGTTALPTIALAFDSWLESLALTANRAIVPLVVAQNALPRWAIEWLSGKPFAVRPLILTFDAARLLAYLLKRAFKTVGYMTIIGPGRCIYCFSTANAFAKEHVLSAFLGGPNRYQLHNCVCRECNSKTISRQENYFKEDSPSGLLAAIYGVGRTKNYRPNYERMRMQILTESEWPFDPDLFTSVDQYGKLCIEKQIILRGKRPNPYIMREKFTPEEIIQRMNWLGGDEIEMVTYGFSDDELTELHTGLEKSGKQAGQVEKRTIDSGTKIPRRAYHVEHLEDRDLKRVVLKTIFNYFAYCAIPGFADLVYGADFNSLRDYVLQDDSSYTGGELVVGKTSAITVSGVQLPSPSKHHLIRIYRETQNVHATTTSAAAPARVLTGELNLFSSTQYKVNLAFDPFPEVLPRFGSGHLLDLEADRWIRINHQGEPDPPDDFTLFRD